MNKVNELSKEELEKVKAVIKELQPLSSLQIFGNPYCSVESCKTVIVWAIGIGSQIPLASINI